MRDRHSITYRRVGNALIILGIAMLCVLFISLSSVIGNNL